jgi:ribosome-binding protein aMBF1 (putative translation factor)
MNRTRHKRLQTAGWRVGDARQFLGLDDVDAALIELKLGFADFLREERLRQDLPQAALAKRIGSSQSRIAKMEAGEPSVSLDLMFRAALSLGVSPSGIGKAMSRAGRTGRSGKKAG